jgi:hypothetical protein
MGFQYARLTAMSFVGSGSGVLYTHLTGSGGVGGDTINTASYIRSVVLHNTNTIDETVSLWVTGSSSLPAAGIALSSSARFYQEAIPTGNTRMIEFFQPGLMLTTHGERLVGGSTSGSKVTVMVFGGQE